MPSPSSYPFQDFVDTDRPSRAVQALARWTVVNVDAGDSAPFILGLALAREPQLSGPAVLEKRDADLAQWQWWLERSDSEAAFIAALAEREGIQLTIEPGPVDS